MKIKFTKLPTTNGTIQVSLDDGESFTDYNVADIYNDGIPLSDDQDYEKIQIQAPANVLKNLNVVSSVKVEGESTNGSSFIMDTDTYGSEFLNCVTGIAIPNGTTTINFNSDVEMYNILNFFQNLKTIVIPESVTSISDCAFKECDNLTNVTISNGVISIGNYAFYGCSSLTSIEIPDSVTSIGNSAFEGCSSLTSIEIPDSVTSIGGYAFERCSSLTNITIGNGIELISPATFESCSSLTSIAIPSSVICIDTLAFSSCTGLTSITIPDSVTLIDGGAFKDCSKLETINYTGTEDQWNAITKGDDWNTGCPSNMVINYNYQKPN